MRRQPRLALRGATERADLLGDAAAGQAERGRLWLGLAGVRVRGQNEVPLPFLGNAKE